MPFPSHDHAGKFLGTPELEFITDVNTPNPTAKLLNDFLFVEVTGIRWTAPAGSLVDASSIPHALWTLFGSPFTASYAHAFIIHNVACNARVRPWQDVHQMFYHACLAGGIALGLAKVMYLAVRNFGPRWPHHMYGENTPGSSTPASSEEAQLRYVTLAHSYVQQHGDRVSLQEIDRYATAAQPQNQQTGTA
ncbi:DUF1353 domain-containing protein [Hymenobacter koreensis]|uniref:DUF1353 domain-containing protein n=1 Tax=Hymenobacter koreensis TaxID=1084523 RepID=A0ABP8ITC8_9BACT